MTPQPARFTSTYDTRALPDAVRAVALTCRPDDPMALTQRQFDAGRQLVPEHADAPTARQICTRLGTSWPSLLRMLFEAGRDPARSTGAWQREDEDHELTMERIVAALQIVAVRRGADTLRPHEYLQSRTELLQGGRRKHRHGTAPDLPTVGQIERVAVSWDRALQAAGLLERPASVGNVASKVAYVEAVRRFLETQGAMPTTSTLQEFAQHQGFPLPRKPPGGHPAALRDVHDAFLKQGRWAPPAPPRRGQHPPYDYASVSTRQAGEQRRRKRVQKEDCVSGVIAYLDALPANGKVSQKDYGSWRTGTRHPAASAFQRYGGWTKLLAEAREQRRARGG